MLEVTRGETQEGVRPFQSPCALGEGGAESGPSPLGLQTILSRDAGGPS